MQTCENLEKRISKLETWSAHQEKEVQDLSDSIAQQWKIIEDLSRLISVFKEKIICLEELSQTNHIDKPPPHY